MIWGEYNILYFGLGCYFLMIMFSLFFQSTILHKRYVLFQDIILRHMLAICPLPTDVYFDHLVGFFQCMTSVVFLITNRKTIALHISWWSLISHIRFRISWWFLPELTFIYFDNCTILFSNLSTFYIFTCQPSTLYCKQVPSVLFLPPSLPSFIYFLPVFLIITRIL